MKRQVGFGTGRAKIRNNQLQPVAQNKEDAWYIFFKFSLVKI